MRCSTVEPCWVIHFNHNKQAQISALSGSDLHQRARKRQPGRGSRRRLSERRSSALSELVLIFRWTFRLDENMFTHLILPESQRIFKCSAIVTAALRGTFPCCSLPVRSSIMRLLVNFLFLKLIFPCKYFQSTGSRSLIDLEISQSFSILAWNEIATESCEWKIKLRIDVYFWWFWSNYCM